MASCLISMIFLWNSSWKMIDNIYTMSYLNVLPSSPPEKIYSELLPYNFRLSRNGAEEIEKYRKVAKKYKKAQTATHDTAVGLDSLSAVLSTTWRRLEPYWPWNYCRCPFLVLLTHFAVLVLLC